MKNSVFERSVEYLKTDLFKHLVTLTYLSLYEEYSTVNLLEDASGWAVLVTIPTELLSYDTETYPHAKKAIFINGTSTRLKYMLLETLPLNNYILRVNENIDLSYLQKQFKIEKGNSFISYSCSVVDELDTILPGNVKITDEAIELIMENGYSESEIRKYFDEGAVWFGAIVNDKIQSICFIHQNYRDIWEVAGVRTLETARHKGYARLVVASALSYILKRNLIPRYVVNVQNTNSIKLAEKINMKRFLQIDHFLMNGIR